MPASPKPIFDARFGHLTPLAQALQFTQQKVAQQSAGQGFGITADQYGNAVEVFGPNIAVVVPIGGAHLTPAVYVTTGVPNGTAGRVVQYSGSATNSAIPTAPSPAGLSCTANTNTATVVGTWSGAALQVGMVIGANAQSEPASGTAAQVIVPGTKISAISGSGPGSTLTLAPPSPGPTYAVLLTASIVYAAACFFNVVT